MKKITPNITKAMQGDLMKSPTHMQMLALPKNRATQGKGKKKGTKNYTKIGDGVLKNEHGFEFDKSEKESWRQAVNRVKRKQKSLTNGKGNKELKELTIKIYGRSGLLGNYSTSMSQFQSREQFEKALERLNNYTKADYVEKDITNHVKENYAKMIEKSGMLASREMAVHIRNMGYIEFMERLADDIGEDFAYMNSDFQDEDDEYIQGIMNRIGFGNNAYIKDSDGQYRDKNLIKQREKEKAKTEPKTPKKTKSKKTPKS